MYQSNDVFYSDVNEIDEYGNTPLMVAIKEHKLDAIKILCDFGASAKLQSFENSYSCLDYAVKNGMKEYN